MSENNSARPWDIFNKKIQKASEDLANYRMEICNGCEFYISLTTQCSKCGCLMKSKTKLPNASCPIGKWNSATI